MTLKKRCPILMNDSESGVLWTGRLFAAIDRMDSGAFSNFLTDDAVFRFGNAEAVEGKEAVTDAVAGFFGQIAGLKHDVHAAWSQDGAVFCHGNVNYERLDGKQVIVPFADVFEMEGTLIRRYLIFIDIAPLFS